MANRLADATSPYLLQHRDNPVDWWEWSDQAFEEARRRDVPVLLSVGYAACHWCHVMAHESFEDEDTAEMMNRFFVNIKVDREERPDVDSIYMEAVQAMTGRGGWPMTVFLDGSGRPFYAGTYFPRQPHHGMPSFQQVLAGVWEAWSERRGQVDDQASRLLEAIAVEPPATGVLPDHGLAKSLEKVVAGFDTSHGGFGTAPKFPQQPTLELLLRLVHEPWANTAAPVLVKTLESMAEGGIRDHVGGGFARYSVDQAWLVPHFEKMLYDNAQLSRIYLWAGIELDRPDFEEVAIETFEYMLADLRHPEGGFFSSEDADSEGVEGKFYVWTTDQIRTVLGAGAETAMEYFGVTSEGNFEGANVLHSGGRLPPDNLDDLKRALAAARNLRVRPGLDDKVVAAWNGLAIRALAEAGVALDKPEFTTAAETAARFVVDRMWDGRDLRRAWRADRTSSTGFLDDYAAMALGCYSLLAATADAAWFDLAEGFVAQFARFARPDGGFYSTPDDGPQLVKRPIDITDNPSPSANALAAEALLVSSLLTGDQQRREEAMSAALAAAPFFERHPTMVSHHLSVLHSADKGRELAIVGLDWQEMVRVAGARFRPELAVAPTSSESNRIPLLVGRSGQPGSTLAYLCSGFVCDLPTSVTDELTAKLEQH